jgi:ribosomal protein S18 acetylase RimI-like enzyme
MKPLTEEILTWNDQSQRAMVEQSLAHQGTSIIVVNGSSVGWLQVDSTSSAIYLGQLYITPTLQKRGVGTAIMKWLCGQARRDGKSVTLEVMKNNQALAFYDHLGFRVVGESKYKYEMRWQATC